MLNWHRALLCGGLIFLVNSDSRVLDGVFSMFAAIPDVVYVGVAGLAVAAAAVDTVIEKADEPFLFFGSLAVFVPVVTRELLGLPRWPTFAGLELVLALAVALILWFLTLWILTCVAVSITGIDLQKRRLEQVDDPYGDKHASRILQSESGQSSE